MPFELEKKEFSTGRKTTVSVQEKLSSSEKAQGRWDGDWDASYEWTTGMRESVILWVYKLVDGYYLQELVNHSQVSCSFSLLLESLSVWFRLRVRSGRACESWLGVSVHLFIPRIIALGELSDKKASLVVQGLAWSFTDGLLVLCALKVRQGQGTSNCSKTWDIHAKRARLSLSVSWYH